MYLVSLMNNFYLGLSYSICLVGFRLHLLSAQRTLRLCLQVPYPTEMLL
jgi:hypothetical protein